VEIKVAAGENLKERLPVKVDFIVVIVGLVVDVRISKSSIRIFVPFGYDESFQRLVLDYADSVNPKYVSPFYRLLLC